MGSKSYMIYKLSPKILGGIILCLGLLGEINGTIPYPKIPMWLIEFHQDTAVELIGIGITVLVIDYSYEMKLEREEKQKLVFRLGSHNNDTAREAARTLRLRKWHNKGVLVEADLRNAAMNDVDLPNANLRRAIMKGAQLKNATLTGANLRRANLEYAELNDASLDGADLRKADMANAKLIGANLENANYDDSQLYDVESLEDTILRDGRTYDPETHIEISKKRRENGREIEQKEVVVYYEDYEYRE